MKWIPALLLALCLLSACADQPKTTAAMPDVDGVVIALVDTGVSTAAIDPERLLPGHNYVTDSEDTEDRINHGTAVASIIVGCGSAEVEGLAPRTYLVPLVVTDKVEGEVKSVAPDVLAQAIRDAVDLYGADVINVSLGVKKDADELRQAVAYAEKQGAVVVSAVGNEGKDEARYYPAAYDTVLAVGSHDRDGEVSAFSQQNGTADILAPGEDIWLASRNGVTYGARGTSYATAYVSAAAALLLEQAPGLTPQEVRQRLTDTAEGGDETTPGRLDLEAALDVSGHQPELAAAKGVYDEDLYHRRAGGGPASDLGDIHPAGTGGSGRERRPRHGSGRCTALLPL